MLRSIVLKDLGKTRKEVMAEACELGVIERSETATKIALAVGETITDCRIHGGYKKVDISVVKVDEGIDIRIAAPCYSEPNRVKCWFDSDCMNVASSKEGGRGCGITVLMTNQIKYHPGAIDLIFALPPTEQVLAGA